MKSPFFAKVRVAGSNPVFRSKYNRRSGTLLRGPDCFMAMVERPICPPTVLVLTSGNGFSAFRRGSNVMLSHPETFGLDCQP